MRDEIRTSLGSAKFYNVLSKKIECNEVSLLVHKQGQKRPKKNKRKKKDHKQSQNKQRNKETNNNNKNLHS